MNQYPMHVVVFYPYADDEHIVMQVVKMSSIFFRESDNEAFSPCYLWYKTR